MTNLFRSQRVLWLLMTTILLAVSCRKPAAAPPPPPPAPPAQPAPPPPAPVMTLRVEPATIQRGQPATLRWEAQNAASVRIEPELGDVATTGNRQVSPNSSVTYTATATGPGGTASDTARITVTEPPPPPPRPSPPPSTPNPTTEDLFRQNVHVIYFDYDKSDIRPDQISTMQANAAWLRGNPGVSLTIEGHCDERGSQEYNIGLGDQRANAVRQYLVDQGIQESRLRTISLGKERPVCTDQTEDCYQRNRRAAFVLNP